MLFSPLLLIVGSVAAINVPPPAKHEENFTLPSVLYVPPSVLALYGLTDSYGPDPPARPTMEHLQSIWANESTRQKIAEYLGTDKGLTLGQAAKAAWEFLDDTTASYFQWVTAHALNAVFAAQSIRMPVEGAALESFYIAMGQCRCPQTPRLGVTFPKVCEAVAKGELNCEVTREEAHTAQDVIDSLGYLNRYWIHTLNSLSADKVNLFGINPNRLIANIQHSTTLSPEYADVITNYHNLVVTERAAMTNQTVEEVLEERKTEKVVWPMSYPEESSEEDVDEDDE